MTEDFGYDPAQAWGNSTQDEAYRFFRQGYEEQMAGRIDAAILAYKKSLELMDTAEAHTFLGWAYSFRGLYDDAIRECHSAIKLDPDYGNPYNDIGAYLIEKGNYDEAIGWLEKATVAKRYDSYCYPHYNLGRIWEHKGDWKKAISAYQAALDSNPGYTLAQKAISRIQGMMN